MRHCTICTHKKRYWIDKAIINNETYRSISNHYKVSTAAIKRHISNGHIQEPIKKARLQAEVEHGKNLDDLITRIVEFSFESAEQARDAYSFNAIGPILGNACRAAELREKIEARLEEKEDEQGGSGLARLLNKLVDKVPDAPAPPPGQTPLPDTDEIGNKIGNTEGTTEVS